MNDIERIINDPVYFAEKYLSLETGAISLTLGQKQLLWDLATPGEYYCERDRQWGKTLTLAIYTVWRTFIDSNRKIAFMVAGHELIKNIHTIITKLWMTLPDHMRCSMVATSVQTIAWQNNSAVYFRKIGYEQLRGTTLNDIIIDEIGTCNIDNAKDTLMAYKPCLANMADSRMIITASTTDREMLENKLKLPANGFTVL
jgi:hypothetical protein